MLATPFFHLLKPEILELSLTPLFLSNPTSNPSGNPVGSTLKIYSESDHLLVISCCTTVAQTTISFSRITAEASQLVFLPCFLSYSWRDLFIETQVRSCCSSAHNPPASHLTQSERQTPPSAPMRHSDHICAATVASCSSNTPAHYLVMTFTRAVPLPGVLFPGYFHDPFIPSNPFLKCHLLYEAFLGHTI